MDAGNDITIRISPNEGKITVEEDAQGVFSRKSITEADLSLWEMLMGAALVPVENVWPTILTYSLAGGALVGALGSTFSIRKHLNV